MQSTQTFEHRENQLRTLSEERAKANPIHANNAYALENGINLAALNGNRDPPERPRLPTPEPTPSTRLRPPGR